MKKIFWASDYDKNAKWKRYVFNLVLKMSNDLASLISNDKILKLRK